MKIGILSDTHDQAERAGRAASLLKSQGAELLIHCGDITTADVVYELHVLPSYFVYGNCDDDRQSLGEAIKIIGGTSLGRGGWITVAGRKIAVTHGDSDSELRRLRQLTPDFLLTGHTHRVSDQREASLRLINPGALHRAPFWSVALLDLKTDALEVLRIDPVGQSN